MKRIKLFKLKNLNFADNWICCNQTDGTWQTPAFGECFEKHFKFMKVLFRTKHSFLLQLQLSEVIARARRYHEEVTGKKGQVDALF